MPKRMVKAPCIRTCHSFSEPIRFKNPHTSDHSPGTPPGFHNGVGPGGNGKFVLTNASSILLMDRESLPDWWRHALLERYSTYCEQQVLRDSAIFWHMCC